MELRSYKESFEANDIELISQLITDLETLGEHPTSYALYTSELRKCLYYGMLLAAVSVSASLLELFVRDLATALKIQSHFDGEADNLGRVERAFEESRSITFDDMLDSLRLIVISPDDDQEMRDFYQQTRIPFAHGLVRRLTERQHWMTGLNDRLALVSRQIDLEDRLEERALSEVAFVVTMMNRYRPWLIRRYSL